MTSALSSLYKNKPVLLWVEDPLTRTWLHHLWQDADIGLLVAGGNEAVHGAVNDARHAQHAHVFGLRDRDFIQPNQTSWLVQTKHPTVFVPNAFEIENFLLDFQGLAFLGPSHNPRRRSAAELSGRAHRDAARSLWWMAARATIADARLAITHQYPGHPRLGSPHLSSKADAQLELEQRLLRSAWGQHVQGWVPNLDTAWIEARLTEHEAALQADLSSGDWRWSWSGKELFNAIAGHLECSIPDLAKGLAEHQRQQGTVEPVMTDLRTALRRRAGLEPWPPATSPP